MIKHILKKISIQQAILTVMVAFVIGVVIGLGQLFIDLKAEKKRLDDTMDQVLSISKESALQAAINLDKELAEQVVIGLFQFAPIYRAELFDNFGDTLAAMERDRPAESRSWKWLVNLILEPSKSYSVELEHPDYQKMMGVMTVEVDIHSFTQNFFSRAVVVICSGLLLTFLLASILSILFHYILTRPLLNIISAFAGITPGDRNTTAITVSPIHRDDELGVLVHTINDQLGRFNHAIKKLTQAEDSLRGSEEQVRLLLNSMAEAIYGLDLDGNCAFVNNSFLRMLGYKRADEFIGKHMHTLIHHSHVDGSRLPVDDCRIHKAFLEEKGVYGDDEVFWRADGTSFPVEYWSYPIVRDNKTIGAVVTFLDISLRKQAEHDLAAEKEHLAVTLRSIGDGVITTDTSGKIILLNRVAELLTGWRSQEAESRPLLEVFNKINGLTGEPCENPVEKIFRTGKNVGFAKHTVLVAKDGTERSIADNAAPMLDKEQRIIGVVLVFRDISKELEADKERQALERQLEQSRKMEAIGTLAGGIAHDFNNILTPIFGNLELALMKMDKDSDLAKYLQEVHKAADRARDIVKQILSFSRHDTENISAIEVHVIVIEALKLLRASIPATIEIKQNIDPHCGSVLAKPTQIHQIVMNICTNAYQAMRETGGILGVTLAPLEISSGDYIRNINLKPGSYLRLEISDTGHGMDRATQERIFEPYFTTKDKGEGTGMGLSIVHGLVNGIGGHVTVYSEPGIGTTFHIYLPVIEKSVASKEIAVETPVPTGTERILLVDDEEQVRDVETVILNELGYEVQPFSSPLEALEHFTAQPDIFDLVITDMAMPKMTGDKLARGIKAIRPAMPVILCTGFSELVDEETARAMGISAYVTKPIIRQMFAMTVRNVLDGVEEE